MTKLPIVESYWVQENKLLAGEYPGDYNPETTRRRMDAFLEAGIDTFIDFTQPNEHVSYEAILKEEARLYDVDVQYHRFAINDHRVSSTETMRNILDTIDEALEKGRKVYLHCWGGIGRTGIAVACHLVRHGMSNEEALAHVHRLYRTRPNNPSYPRSPETNEQIDFVRSWREIPDAAHKSKQNFCEG
jgi:protein-tyrosine phosphatase